METKQTQRKACKQARAQLTSEIRAMASHTICECLKKSEEVQKAEIILTYFPYGAEVDLGAFNAWATEQGKQVAYPICSDNYTMIAAVPLGPEAFEKGMYGICAPRIESSQVIAPDAIDVVLVPCVGFDEEKVRLGMGKGYYDRYLVDCRKANKIVVAYEAQGSKKIIKEPFDMKMDWIVTEKGLR